jgi:hypothetical protein
MTGRFSPETARKCNDGRKESSETRLWQCFDGAGEAGDRRCWVRHWPITNPTPPSSPQPFEVAVLGMTNVCLGSPHRACVKSHASRRNTSTSSKGSQPQLCNCAIMQYLR